jgi:ParB-like chromosome segregation protein Spo0J
MGDSAATPLDAAAWPASKIELRAVASLLPSARNPRKHSPTQIAEIAASIREWGWTVPALVDETDEIIAGHGRVLAARQLGIVEVPVVVARGWTEAQKRAYRIADNELAAHSTWNKELLRVELADLQTQAVDLTLMGFAADDRRAQDEAEKGELPKALQLEPAREYAVIMCADAEEWERLKVALNLTPVRRGGYKRGSPFDEVGTQRVVTAAALLERLEPCLSRSRVKAAPGASARKR